MRFQIHVGGGGKQQPRRFLLAVPDDADVGQLRASILSRLQLLYADLASIRRISLHTQDGYRIDIQDADKAAELVSADATIIATPEIQHDPDDALRSLIGNAILPPSPKDADDALQRLCCSLNDDNIDRLGAFIANETRRRHRLHFLLDIRPDLLRRLLTPELITAAVDAVADQHDHVPQAPLTVLCRAVSIEPSATVHETVRCLARCPTLRPEMGRLVRDRLAMLPPKKAPAPPAQWTVTVIEALNDAQYDGVVHGLMADAEQGQFREFVRLAIETRFESRMAADPDLVAVLYDLVRVRRSTWAARVLGLLWRHCKTKVVGAAIADLNQTIQDPILRIHLQ